MIDKDFTHGGNVHKASTELGIPCKKIVDFSANINPLGLSSKGLKNIKRNISNVLNYPDPNYSKLKKSLSEYYGVDRDQVLLGNGAIQLIYSYTRLKNKGKALIPAPGFVEYEKALLQSGWSISLYSSKSEIIPDDVDVIFICNPNNPTGVSYSESFLINLLERCKNSKTDLFLDEAFTEYSAYPSLSNYINKYNNLYILKSLTKFFAIPGLRLGAFLTSNKEFLENSTNNFIPWSINSVVEDYIVSGVKDKKYIKRSIKYIKNERYWLYKKLCNIDGLKVYRSQGNYLLFKISSGIDLSSILKKRGILIRSCSNYNNLDSSYYRVAVKKHFLNRLLIKHLSEIFHG